MTENKRKAWDALMTAPYSWIDLSLKVDTPERRAQRDEIVEDYLSALEDSARELREYIANLNDRVKSLGLVDGEDSETEPEVVPEVSTLLATNEDRSDQSDDDWEAELVEAYRLGMWSQTSEHCSDQNSVQALEESFDNHPGSDNDWEVDLLEEYHFGIWTQGPEDSFDQDSTQALEEIFEDYLASNEEPSQAF